MHKTGIKDKFGREVCVGDKVAKRIALPRHGIGDIGFVVATDDGYKIAIPNTEARHPLQPNENEELEIIKDTEL